jgi:hypothetical protein
MRGTTSAIPCSTSCSSVMVRHPHSSRRQVHSMEQAVTEPPRRDGRTTSRSFSMPVLRELPERHRHTSGEKLFSSRDDACATAAQELQSAARATPPARKQCPCRVPTHTKRAEIPTSRAQPEMRRARVSTSCMRTAMRRAGVLPSRLSIARWSMDARTSTSSRVRREVAGRTLPPRSVRRRPGDSRSRLQRAT